MSCSTSHSITSCHDVVVSSPTRVSCHTSRHVSLRCTPLSSTLLLPHSTHHLFISCLITLHVLSTLVSSRYTPSLIVLRVFSLLILSHYATILLTPHVLSLHFTRLALTCFAASSRYVFCLPYATSLILSRYL
eukprot:Awhi_evm1s14382